MTVLPEQPPLLASLVGAVLVGVGLTGCGTDRLSEVPPRQVGPFTIIAKVERIADSGAFLRTGNPFGTLDYRVYGVQHRGRRLQLPGGEESFAEVMVLAGSPRPALLVARPPFMQVLSDANGRLVHLDLASDIHRLQFLDAVAGQPGPSLESFGGLQTLDQAPSSPIAAGRLLLINSDRVLNLDNLRTVRLEPWWQQQSGQTVILEVNASNGRAIALSPGRRRVVLEAEAVDYNRGGERFTALLLLDLENGRAQPLRVAGRVVRVEQQGPALDAVWLDSHYQWIRDGNGHEDLGPR